MLLYTLLYYFLTLRLTDPLAQVSRAISKLVDQDFRPSTQFINELEKRFGNRKDEAADPVQSFTSMQAVGRYMGMLDQVLSSSQRYAESLEEVNKELSEAWSRFYTLAMHQQRRIEEERTKISREIHDELGQRLTALRMGISRLNRYADDPETLLEKMYYLMGIAAQTIASVQCISGELSPMHLDDMGLNAAVKSLAREFENATGLAMELHFSFNEKISSKDLVTATFRVIQESLTNAARNPRADQVAVSIISDLTSLTVSITDNGTGIDPIAAASPDSFGLVGMRERVHYLGGSFEVDAAPGGGTRAREVFPHSAAIL